MFETTIKFIRDLFDEPEGFVPLHAPLFTGNEKQYLAECIDSTFVSSVGTFVGRFEGMVAEFTGAERAVATVNGTSALHAALKLVGVGPGDEVITQPLTFIATCNAITYCGARPVFVDVDGDTLGLSPSSLEAFLKQQVEVRDGAAFNRQTGKRIAACVPMHTFGFPCRIEQIVDLCSSHGIHVVEDAAESLGSFVGKVHTGLFGRLGVLSFNGNKTITTGGGGMIITNDDELGAHAKHLTTTAKIPDPTRFAHDEIGFNYRMPNLNAALGCAQMEKLAAILEDKRQIANAYREFFSCLGSAAFMAPLPRSTSNYWLNTLILPDKETRDHFLDEMTAAHIMARPAWVLMHHLNVYSGHQTAELPEAESLANRIVTMPSSPRLE